MRLVRPRKNRPPRAKTEWALLCEVALEPLKDVKFYDHPEVEVWVTKRGEVWARATDKT